MQNTDTIFITDITLPCTIGVPAEERKQKQQVVINITLSVDLRKAGKTDKLADTVNYGIVYAKIVELVNNAQFSLMEALADAVATICLEDKRVVQTKIRVEKARYLKLAKSNGIEIIRNNE